MTLDLDKENIVLFGTEGSGHQSKAWVVKNGIEYLIKVNSKYREASKEVSVSKFLETIGIPHAEYEIINVTIGNKKRVACISKSYLDKNEASIPFYNLLSLDKYRKGMSARDIFNQVTIDISYKTGLDTDIVSNWIKTCLTIDYIVMNPDRHYSNMEVIRNNITGTYRLPPLFDFGRSFLGRDGMMIKAEFTGMEQKFKTLPFSSNQEKNLIDIKFAQHICMYIANNINKINNLDIPDFHKFVIKYRLNKILSLR